MKDEVAELVKLARIRNALLTVQTLKHEVRQAAERVVRLSEPGTPERLFTLQEVAAESGVSATEIVDALASICRCPEPGDNAPACPVHGEAR